MATTAIRVVIADDHPVFREGVARGLRSWPGIELVGETGDGRDALARIRADAPDVALVDMRLPGLDGIEVARAVTRDRLATRVVILSGFDDDDLVYGAISAGATGYVTKDATADAIARAVLAAGHGDMALDPRLAGALVGQVRRRGQIGASLLTDRELQVLGLLADGLAAPEIGRRLFLATSTIKTHLAHLYEKLGVSDRAAAVAEAMRRGLIE